MTPFAGIQRMLGKSLRTLPSRMSLFVFGTTFITTAVCAYTSISSFQQFLDERIDEKFPHILIDTADRIENWYEAVVFGMESYSETTDLIPRDATLKEMRDLGQNLAFRKKTADQLSDFLEQSNRIDALFVLNDYGETIAWAGKRPALFKEHLQRLAEVDHSTVSNLIRLDDDVLQSVSIPLFNQNKKKVASLHALVDVDVLLPLLKSDQIGESGRIFILDEIGQPFILQQMQEGYRYSEPDDENETLVERYTNDAKERVIGSSLPFGHFGWTLAVEELQSEVFAPRTAIVRKVLGLNLTIILFFSGISILLARTISRPVRELATAARRITNGETDVVIMERSAHDEIALLTLAFNRMSKKLHHNQVELKGKQRRIEASNAQLKAQNHELQGMVETLNQLSITDGLTKLYNHRYFQQQLRVEIARATRSKTPLFIVLIDIDNFKNLNDHYGHAAGDLALVRVADIMREQIRENDLLARYGGEEFALVPGQTDLEGALSLAEKIRMAIGNARFQLDTSSIAENVSITVSVGVAPFTGDLKQSFNHADQALYRAKGDGKDCVRLYGVDS